jgi:hypothetical protein
MHAIENAGLPSACALNIQLRTSLAWNPKAINCTTLLGPVLRHDDDPQDAALDSWDTPDPAVKMRRSGGGERD